MICHKSYHSSVEAYDVFLGYASTVFSYKFIEDILKNEKLVSITDASK